MSRYADRLQSAGLELACTNLQTRLESLEDGASEVLEGAHPGLTSRLDHLLDRLLVALGSASPALVTEAQISATSTTLTALDTALTAFLDSADESEDEATQLAELDRQSEALATRVQAWPLPTSGTDLTDVSATYKRSLAQRLKPVNAELESLSRATAQLKAGIAQIDTAVSDKAAAVEASLMDELSGVTAAVEAAKAEIVTAREDLASQKTRVDQAISRVDERFTEEQTKRTEAYDGVLAKQQKRHDELMAVGSSKSEELLEGLTNQLDEAKRLVTAIAVAGTSDAYSKEATAQAGIADRWRLVATAMGMLAFIFVLVSVFQALRDEPSMSTVILKVTASAAVTGLATYAARQSAHHRRREEAAKRLELHLLAFDPFIELLDDTRQQELRVSIARSIFGVGEASATADQLIDGALTEHHFSQLERLATLLTKANGTSSTST